MKRRIVALGVLLALALAASPWLAAGELWHPVATLDDVARNYVLLVLRIDKHLPGFNDYYYGPPEWKQRVEAEEKIPLAELRREAAELLASLDRVGGNRERLWWFRKQLLALDTNLRKLEGEQIPIREQALLLLDLEVTPPTLDELDSALEEIDRLLPGEGSLRQRLQDWQAEFTLSDEQLPQAYEMALAVTREHAHELLLLPADEEVELHFVSNQSWGAYNWFQGNAHSRIEVNTDLPASAVAIFDFAAHEAYPGHHTDLLTREQRLYRERGYLEWCVSPLFTPMNAMAEAVAQVGTELVLTPEEKLAWHRDVFFPALGIEGVDLEQWVALDHALETLRRARERVPFMLFDEGQSDEEVIAYLERYALLSEAGARKALEFNREWGAYTFNYTVGREILRRYLASGN
ncbi:MAG: hypothetical protein ACE5G6_03450, partial [Terriglobia bacterium]